MSFHDLTRISGAKIMVNWTSYFSFYLIMFDIIELEQQQRNIIYKINNSS